MALIDDAAQAVIDILTDTSGFGVTMTVQNPEGISASVVGHAADIGKALDPDTGLPVLGRQCHVTLPMSTLRSSGVGIPRDVNDSDYPWLVMIQLPGMTEQSCFRITDTMPDYTVGCVVCFLTFFAQ